MPTIITKEIDGVLFFKIPPMETIERDCFGSRALNQESCWISRSPAYRRYHCQPDIYHELWCQNNRTFVCSNCNTEDPGWELHESLDSGSTTCKVCGKTYLMHDWAWFIDLCRHADTPSQRE